jgi:hypothetical protein
VHDIVTYSSCAAQRFLFPFWMTDLSLRPIIHLPVAPQWFQPAFEKQAGFRKIVPIFQNTMILELGIITGRLITAWRRFTVLQLRVWKKTRPFIFPLAT